MKDDIEKLLTEDDIRGVLADITKEVGEGELNELIVIYSKGDKIYWQSNRLIQSRLIFLLEGVKYAVFKEREEE